MAISELSIEEKKQIKELTDKLLEATNLKESLLDQLSPLTDELLEITKEEKEKSELYENTLNGIVDSSYSSNQTEILKENADRLLEIANRKNELDIQIKELKDQINPILENEKQLIEDISSLKGKEQENKEEEQEELSESIIVIRETNLSNLKEDINIDSSKNSITKTNTTVMNFIKKQYEKAKNKEVSIAEELNERISEFYKSIIKPSVDDLMKEFNEDTKNIDKVDELLNERKKVSEQAENLEMSESIVQESEPEEPTIENENVVVEPETEPVQVEEPVISEPIKEEIEVKEEIPQENSIFTNTPITEEAKTEVEQTIKESDNKTVSSYASIDHFVKRANNDIAKTTKAKRNTTIEIFKLYDKISDKIDQVKEAVVDQENQIQEQNVVQNQEISNQGNDKLEDYTNIFSDKAMAV